LVKIILMFRKIKMFLSNSDESTWSFKHVSSCIELYFVLIIVD